jgi:membrane associated rhomboid family serine protease
MSGPDLFVVCKNCSNEVSQYVTECPYCGTRLRKRAPKLDRPGAREPRRRRPTAPSLGRLRAGEIPGIRPDSRPYATIVLVLVSLAVTLSWRGGWPHLADLAVRGDPGAAGWHLITAAFVYDNSGYQLAALVAVGVFGWLLERRHGPLAPILVFLAGAVGGLAAAAAIDPNTLALGGNGGALALLSAWTVPDLHDLRAGEEVEGDLLGAGVIAAVLLLMPIATATASPISGVAGLLIGLVLGEGIARLRPAR